MRNEHFENYVLPRISDKKRQGKDNTIKKIKIKIKMSMDIVRATKINYGPIHSADPKHTNFGRTLIS